MPDKKISDLTSGSAIGGTEELPIVQGSTTVKTTINAIKTYFNTIFAAISSPTFIGTVTTPAINVSGLTASQTVGTDASKNLVSIPFGTTAGTVMQGFTDYTESFVYTGGSFNLSVVPTFIYSIRTTSMVLDESDINDVTIVGTTLTVINPAFQAGEKLYIKYKG